MGPHSLFVSQQLCHPKVVVAAPTISTAATISVPHIVHRCRRKDKIVFVMGATGTGKSRLSFDIAAPFNAEIVNSDKMQVYKDLDIVTNKVTRDERAAIPHHLLGIVDDPDYHYTAADFRRDANDAVESILARRRLPVIAGGSNSYIEALVDGDNREFRTKYECCFLWVDVSLPVLYPFLYDRVDRMVEAGMVEEVRQLFHKNRTAADYTRGIRRAIGVPEMDGFLRAEAGEGSTDAAATTKKRLLEAAISEIKRNSCRLARRQLGKIERLRGLPGWHMHRLDATEVFRRRGEEAEEAWKEKVAAPALEIVRNFSGGDRRLHHVESLSCLRKAGKLESAAAATW